MFLRIFTTFFFFTAPTLVHAESYSCSLLLKDTCQTLPACQYNSKENTCVGTIHKIPRFMYEFQRESGDIFSIEDILKSKNLQELSLNWKPFAKFIKEEKIKEPWVLNFATSPDHFLQIKKFFSLTSTYKIPKSSLSDYPSAIFLLFREKEILKLAEEGNIPLLTLLKIPNELLFSLLEESGLEKLKALNINLKDYLEHQSNFLNIDLDTLKKFLEKTSLPSKDLLKLNKNQIEFFYNSENLFSCLEKNNGIWEWLSKIEYSSIYGGLELCKKTKEIQDLLEIGFQDFPTQEESITKLNYANLPNVKKIKDEYGLSGITIIDKDLASNLKSREDIEALMQRFSLSLEEALLVPSYLTQAWLLTSQKDVEDLARQNDLSPKEMLNFAPDKLNSPSLRSLSEILNLSVKHLVRFDLSILSHPESFKELMELYKETTGQTNVSDMPIYHLKNLSENPKKMEEFKQNWSRYKSIFTFQELLTLVQSKDGVEFKTKLLFKLVFLGDYEAIKNLAFLEESGYLFHDSHISPYTYAKNLGYEDIAKLLEPYKLSVIRYEASGNSKRLSKCLLEDMPFSSRRPSWYQRCHQYEKTHLVYKNEVGHFIETQIDFWHQTQIAKIPTVGSKSVKDALLSYQGSGYTDMGKYIGDNKETAFPYFSEGRVEQEINAINFSLLLAPKSDFEIVSFRGQSNTIERITDPSRFWSTSANAYWAKNWGNAKGFLEVHIPKGYPLFFLNIGGRAEMKEHEFLLPSHALNKDGKLVLARYEILEEKSKKFSVIEYDAASDIEQQFLFDHLTFVVRPVSDMMVFDESKESFQDYQKRYRELVCAPENLHKGEQSLDSLKAICKAAQTWIP